MSSISLKDAKLQLEAALSGILSPDNQSRREAEAAIESMKKNDPVIFFAALIETFCFGNEPLVVQCAGVLAKNTIRDKNLFSQIMMNSPHENIENIKQNLLSRLGSLNLSSATRKVSVHLIVAFASKLTAFKELQGNNNQGAVPAGGAPQQPTSGWPELWESLLSVAVDDSQMPDLRGSCIHIYAECTTALLYCSDIKEHMTTLQEVLAQFLSNVSKDQKLAAQAAEATGQIVASSLIHTQALDRQSFDHQLAPLFVTAFDSAFKNNNSDKTNEEDFSRTYIQAVKELMKEDEENGIVFFSETDTLQPLLQTILAATQRVVDDPDLLDDDENVEFIDGNCEMLLDICENATNFAKSNKDFVATLFTFFCDLMRKGIDVIDFETYGSRPEDVEPGSTTTAPAEDLKVYQAGAMAIDRLSLLLKGKQLDALVSPVVQSAVGSEDWKQVTCAIGLIAYAFEGLKKALKAHLPMLMTSMIIPALHHSHVFVRNQALMCLSQLSVDDCPDFQMKYFPALLPKVCKMIHEDNDCPRNEAVAARFINTALNAIDNAEDIEHDPETDYEGFIKETAWLDPFFPPLLQSLLGALMHYKDAERKPSFVIYALLKAVGDVVQVANRRIAPFAVHLIPALQEIVGFYFNKFRETSASRLNEGATSITAIIKEDEEFRFVAFCFGAAIECATLTFSYLPKEDFAHLTQTAMELTTFLIDCLEKLNLKVYDEILKFILRGLTCTSEFLGDDMVPVLPRFFPALLKFASAQAEMITEDLEIDQLNDETPDEFSEEFGQMQVVRIAGSHPGDHKVVKVPTDLIEVKDLAATIIFTLCDTLQGILFETAPQIAQLAMELLGFAYNGDVRENGSCILSSLLTKVFTNNKRPEQKHLPADELESARVNLIQGAFHALLNAVENEDTLPLVPEQLRAVQAMLRFAPEELMMQALEKVVELLDNMRERAIDEIETARDMIEDEFDEDEEGAMETFTEEVDKPEDVLNMIHEVVGEILKRCSTPVVLGGILRSRLGADFIRGFENSAEIYEQYSEYLAQKMETKRSSKKTAKAGSKKAAMMKQQQAQIELQPSFNPVLQQPNCCYYFGLAGYIVDNSKVEVLAANPEFLQMVNKFLFVFCGKIQSIDESQTAQAAVWSLGVILKFYSRLNKIIPPAERVKIMDKVSVTLAVFEFLLFTPVYDADDEDFAPVVTNTVSALVHALTCFTNEELAGHEGILEQVRRLLSKVLELLPLEGDEEECNTVIYSNLIAWAQSDDHPIFGKNADCKDENDDEGESTMRATLIDTLKNMVGADAMNAENEALVKGL